MRRLIILIAILLIVLGVTSGINQYFPQVQQYLNNAKDKTGRAIPGSVKVVTEESVVIDVVKKVGPSVVTIAATDRTSSGDPFSIFGPQQERPRSNEPQNIGSGFVVSTDGIIITNKHVVSDRGIQYTVVTSDEKKYKAEKIYRDPLNDVAIIKITPGMGANLKPVELGDSSKLQVGQMAIAIGTPLGKFNNSVTQGIVSGLGRGITAGSVLEGFVEQLDNVIQTDAAINPGNSGGPLLNSSGQVIGINTAVSQSGENIGFALPINLVKESMKNFNSTGQFNRPFLGVSYRMITKEVALRNDVPEGAYVEQVVPGSAAEKAGVKDGDIITKFDGKKVEAKNGELAQFISQKKVGDAVTMTLFRASNDTTKGTTLDVKATLEAAPDE